MSSFSEEINCPHCGGRKTYHISTGSCPEDNYAYCFACGKGQSMQEYQMTLKELNEEREIWGLPPLNKLPGITPEEITRMVVEITEWLLTIKEADEIQQIYAMICGD